MDDFIVLTTTPTEIEAKMLAMYLESDGIPCLVGGQRIPLSQLNWSTITASAKNSHPHGGVEVKIEPENLPMARKILAAQYIGFNQNEYWSVKRPVNLYWKLLGGYLLFCLPFIFFFVPELRWHTLGIVCLFSLRFYLRD